MKITLDDSQKAIIKSTLNDQLKVLPDMLRLNKLSKQESDTVSHILKTCRSLVNYMNRTSKRELDFSRQQLAVIAFSLTSFEETCKHLLNENDKLTTINPNMKNMIELMLSPTLSSLTVINNALEASKE